MRHKATMVVGVNGHLHVPAAIQEAQEASYNDEVRVIFPNLGTQTEVVGFRRYITANMSLTVPPHIRRRFNISQEPVEVIMHVTGDVWEKDTPTGTRGGNRAEVSSMP